MSHEPTPIELRLELVYPITSWEDGSSRAKSSRVKQLPASRALAQRAIPLPQSFITALY